MSHRKMLCVNVFAMLVRYNLPELRHPPATHLDSRAWQLLLVEFPSHRERLPTASELRNEQMKTLFWSVRLQ